MSDLERFAIYDRASLPERYAPNHLPPNPLGSGATLEEARVIASHMFRARRRKPLCIIDLDTCEILHALPRAS